MLKKITGLVMVIIVSCLLMLNKALAQESPFNLEKDLKYTIILELNQTFAYKLKDVTVVGTVEIDKKTFLSVRIQGLIKESLALISLDSIKAIIPQINTQEELIPQKSK